MPQSRQTYLGDIVSACMLLSRLPCGWYKFDKKSPPRLDRAGWAFPVVGLLIGVGGAFGLITMIVIGANDLSSATAGIIIMTVLSGAMHDDGLADMADGCGGGATTNDKIRIMHDSSVGSYGVLALCFSVLMKVSLLESLCSLPLPLSSFLMLVVLIAAVSRWQLLALLRAFSVSKKARLGRLTGPPSLGQLIFSTLIWLLPCTAMFGPVTTLVLAGAALFATLCVGKVAMAQIDGLTGDIMGASVVIAEIFIMIAIVILTNFMPQILS